MENAKTYRRVSVLCTSLGLIGSLFSNVYMAILATLLFIVAIWLELYSEEISEDDGVDLSTPVVMSGMVRNRKLLRA